MTSTKGVIEYGEASATTRGYGGGGHAPNRPFQSSVEKGGSDEDISEAETTIYQHQEDATQLSDHHRQYLMQRHGTAELEPVPDPTDDDPYNWPTWKKVTNLSLVAFHAMMATFIAASIQSAFGDIAAEFDITIQQASYLVSLTIAIIGVAPLLWRPLSDRYGRRPVFLVSLICSAVGNVGCAVSPSYATMALCRAITSFFICPPCAIGSAVVTEMFFKKDRAKYMGVWTLMITLGVPLAPFLMGFVAFRVGYRWIYYIIAIANAVQFLLYIPFGPETLYMRSTTATATTPTSTKRHSRFSVIPYRINPAPIRLFDFVHPFTLVTKPNIFIPAVAYAMIFLIASIFISIELPSIFIAAFGLNTEQIGLQYISLIVGSVIGEQLGGALSDRWMRFRLPSRSSRSSSPDQITSEDKQVNEDAAVEPRQPEFRLYISYPGFLLAIVGVIVFLVQTHAAASTTNGKPHWNITPLIGAAIAAAGNQIVTTVMVTYAVDCYRQEAASIGVFISFVRQIWGFIGPFWFTSMIDQVGLLGSAGVLVALMAGVSVLPTIVLHFFGGKWRKA